MASSFASFTINDTGYLKLPNGTVAERPGSPSTGMIRYNSIVGTPEVYNGSSWEFLYTGYPIQNGLVLYIDPSNTLCYSGSGTTLNDMSGNGYNLTMRGTTAVSNGVIDNGSSADTTNFITGSASIMNGRTSWTMSMWVWLHSRNSSLDTYFECGATNDCLICTNASNQIQGENGGSGTSISNFFDGYSTSTGEWFNLTVAATSNSWYVYKNGGLIGTLGISSTATVNSAWGCYWGQEADNNIADSSGFEAVQKMLGKYGMILTYNRALSAAEVMKNYNLTRDKFGGA